MPSVSLVVSVAAIIIAGVSAYFAFINAQAAKVRRKLDEEQLRKVERERENWILPSLADTMARNHVPRGQSEMTSAIRDATFQLRCIEAAMRGEERPVRYPKRQPPAAAD